MSKLYTEEQVIAGIKLFRGVTEESAKKVVELLSSIEMSTNEEIDKKFMDFLQTELELGISDKATIERVKTMHKEEVKESYREGRSDRLS